MERVTIDRTKGRKRSIIDATEFDSSKGKNIDGVHKKASIEPLKLPYQTPSSIVTKDVFEEVEDATISPDIPAYDLMSQSNKEAGASTSRSDVGKETPSNVFGLGTEFAMIENAEKVQTNSNPSEYSNETLPKFLSRPAVNVKPSNATGSLDVRSGGTAKVLMFVKFGKREIKIFTHSRLKGTIIQIKNFAISSIKVGK